MMWLRRFFGFGYAFGHSLLFVFFLLKGGNVMMISGIIGIIIVYFLLLSLSLWV